MSFSINFDLDLKVWSGPSLDPIYNPDVSVGFLILNRLLQTPNKIIQIVHETGSELTCKKIYEKTIKIANFLTTQGFKQGDIIGLIAKNSENVAPALFACLTLGLPFNPFPSAMSEHDLTLLVEKTKPKLFLCDLNEVEKIKNVTRKIGVETKIVLVNEKVKGLDFLGQIVKSDFDVKKFE